MVRYIFNNNMTALASTPNDADFVFIREAEAHGLFLYKVLKYNSETDLHEADALKYFGTDPTDLIVRPNEYLVLLGDKEWLKMSEKTFKTLLIPVDGEEEASLKGKSFYLDAGHGGNDSGAVNNNLGLQEKIAALDTCLFLGEAIEKAGGKVYYSRTGDTYPTITQRAEEANKLAVDLVVSIHLNSAENTSATGIETLVYAMVSTAGSIANNVQELMVAATGWKNRGVKARPDLGILRLTKMPAILCEIGFISNDEEAKELFKIETQKKIAQAICNGIKEYYA